MPAKCTSLTKEEILALPNHLRLSLPVSQARLPGLVIIDGIGGQNQFVGSPDEFESYKDALRGFQNSPNLFRRLCR